MRGVTVSVSSALQLRETFENEQIKAYQLKAQVIEVCVCVCVCVYRYMGPANSLAADLFYIESK